MASVHPAEASLPTLSKLGNPTLEEGLDTVAIAKGWFASFSKAAEAADVAAVLGLLIDSEFTSGAFGDGPTIENPNPDALSVYWRDLLALTWDLRTFEGAPSIAKVLEDRLASTKLSNLSLEPSDFAVERWSPELAWITLVFTFDTEVGHGRGLARIVPMASQGNVVWKGHTIFTNLEGLKGYPELRGPHRNPKPNHGKWEAERQKELAFEDRDPAVLIIGGGHSGLNTAARLRMLGVSHLVVEQNPRIGDNWRTRYEALSLHDPVWANHLPYVKFPDSWPVFIPAKKMANWQEHYAEILELNVWTSTKVISATQDDVSKVWSVLVKKGDGTERTFKVNHVVFATGFMGGEKYVPNYPGAGIFKGQILHSFDHKGAKDHLGKKVVVVGAATASHDICMDYADHGVDVTMFQRSSTYIISAEKSLIPIMFGSAYSENGPPAEQSDFVGASIPKSLALALDRLTLHKVNQIDKELLDGLHVRGFRTNNGYKDCGLPTLVWTRAGGYYLDTGASQYIIDGKIKLKNDSQIKGFTETGLQFENGSEIEADVVVFCTGMNDSRLPVNRIIGERKLGRIWGLNEEGEFNNVWKEMDGIENLWNIMGNLGLCRFYSKHLALQIKAKEVGLFSSRYTRL